VTDITYLTISSELTPPVGGYFPSDKVTEVWSFWYLKDGVKIARYQIRVEQRDTEANSYAGLYTFSETTRTWVPLVTHKIYSRYGIESLGAEFDSDIFTVIIEDLLAICNKFEGEYEVSS
jgi:hypothetical protein